MVLKFFAGIQVIYKSFSIRFSTNMRVQLERGDWSSAVPHPKYTPSPGLGARSLHLGGILT